MGDVEGYQNGDVNSIRGEQGGLPLSPTSDQEYGDKEGTGLDDSDSRGDIDSQPMPSPPLAFKLDLLSLNSEPAVPPGAGGSEGEGRGSGCSTPHSDSTLEDIERVDVWDSEQQPQSLSELASVTIATHNNVSPPPHTDTVSLGKPPLQRPHPHFAHPTHHPPRPAYISGTVTHLASEDMPPKDQWAGSTPEEGRGNGKVLPWQQWTAKFHEVDHLSQGSQPLYEEDHFAMLPPEGAHVYGPDNSPHTLNSLQSTFEGSYASGSPVLHPPVASGSSGYHSDGGLSTTSSMEELTIINTEARGWSDKTGQSSTIVKPVALSQESVTQQYHTHEVNHSVPQPYVLPWQHSHSVSRPAHQGVEYSLSQPWGGGGSDLYGYTLSQPTGVGYSSSQTGLTLGGRRHGFPHSGQSREVKLLHNAAASGKHLLLHRLLGGSHPQLSPITRNEAGFTPIHQSAQHGHLHCLQFLVKLAPPNAVHLWDNDCNTPTLLAIQNGHLECVKWLIEGAAVPLVVRDSGGETLLHYAAFHGQGKILEWLLERMRITDDAADADDIVDHSGVTPGHFAAYYGHLACLQILWAQGVDLVAKDKFDHTPADWARSAGQALCLNYLTTVETCCNLMEENSELQQQVFDLQVQNQQVLEEVRCISSSHQREVNQLRHEYESKMERSKPLNHAKPRRLKGHEAYRITLTGKQPVARHSLEDIEVQKERAKEELKKRKLILRQKLQENRDQKDPKDVLAVMRALSPMSPMLRKQRLTLVQSKPRRDSVSKSVTFADEVAATVHQQQHKRSTSLVEIDIDAAIRRNSLEHSVPVGPQDQGYREVSIDRALELENANTTLEVNIDEVIQKRGPRLHRGIMKRTHT